ncbi:AhpC/TSA family protein [Colletotrichum lupini]|uniref:thioredoxin-dependent peroxiredoxin n=1 Tax=Colletotrichum lupini TaxID=145971 RepID=A0A9Q8SY11_9PEZI|nr:AhpC/TSA family protein [Colletotrichum lupini]UQC85609.1 AhpC/TSA family protein [Colletotrichum lupini]
MTAGCSAASPTPDGHQNLGVEERTGNGRKAYWTMDRGAKTFFTVENEGNGRWEVKRVLTMLACSRLGEPRHADSEPALFKAEQPYNTGGARTSTRDAPHRTAKMQQRNTAGHLHRISPLVPAEALAMAACDWLISRTSSSTSCLPLNFPRFPASPLFKSHTLCDLPILSLYTTMPVELRKRKAPEPAPAPAPKKASSKVAKAADKVKGAVKGKAEKPAEKPVEKVAEKPVEKPAAANGSGKKVKAAKGETIDLDGFGGDIETNDGEKTTLKELVDKSKAGVVLFTYPKASTPGCTKQACLFRDSYEPLTKTGFAIYGLSMDSPKANTTFKEKQKLPYPLLCDPKATLIAAIGLKKPPKSTQRGVFVVDKAGKVLIAEPGSPAGTVDVVTALIEGGDVDGAEEAATEAPAADAKEEEEAANGEVKADEEKKEDAADEAEKKDEKKDE